VIDNLNIHSAPDALLFSLLHPRWEFWSDPLRLDRSGSGDRA
jgi:hypothetical protein